MTEVPLVYYSDQNRRHVIGKAKVRETPEGLVIDATLTSPLFIEHAEKDVEVSAQDPFGPYKV